MTSDRRRTAEPDGDGGFLSRWSRRKRGEAPEEAERPAPVAAPEEPPEKPPEKPPEEPREKPSGKPPEPSEDERNREAAEAVDLESLTYESDFDIFMKPGVPAELRGRALRKLWRSNPLLANLDGLNDYDEDFTTPRGAALTAIKTAWRVGQGFLEGAEVQGPTAKEEAIEADAEERPAGSTSLRAPGARPAEEGEVAEEGQAEKAAEPAAEESDEAPAEQAPRRVGIRARLDLAAFREPSSES